MTHDTTTNKQAFSRDIDRDILRAIASIQYGSVEITIHESQVVQIECLEKIRVPTANSIRKLG